MVGGWGSAPASQSAKVTPSGVVQSDPPPRRQSSGAASTYSVQLAMGSVSSCSGVHTARVRAGSMASHAAIRAETQPVGRPACRPAVANAASRGGPIACAVAHRSASWSASPTSRQIWRPAVLYIILRPAGPRRSKTRRIARYRGVSNMGRGDRWASMPPAPRTNPARPRSAVSWAISALVAATRAATEVCVAVETSTCPPGSTVTELPYRNGWAGLVISSVRGLCGPNAARSRLAPTGRAGSTASCTIHSSSVPSHRGGPVLKQIRARWPAAAAGELRTVPWSTSGDATMVRPPSPRRRPIRATVT